MHHLRRLSPDEWPRVPVDPEDPDAGVRDATASELLNMYGLVPLGRDEDGDWICDCHRADDRWRRGLPTREEVDVATPGTRVSEGRRGMDRYHRAPPEIAVVAWRQTVYRAPGLRTEARRDAGRPDASARISRVGRGTVESIDHREPDRSDVVDEARKRAGDGDARRLRVPVREVSEDDVVDGEPVPHRFAGESP